MKIGNTLIISQEHIDYELEIKKHAFCKVGELAEIDSITNEWVLVRIVKGRSSLYTRIKIDIAKRMKCNEDQN